MGAFSPRLGSRRFAFLAALLGAGIFVAVAGAQAIVATHVPTGGLVINPCTGEPVTITGFIHTETHTTNSGLMHTQMNLQDAKGEVALTGVKYVATSTSSAVTSVPPGSHENAETTTHLVRQRDDGTFVLGDDFRLKARVQFVVNANGVVTVNNVEVTTEPCG